jgi:NADH-quinone oxidoreductase subunit G
MSTQTAAPPQLLNVQINGQWLQFPKGTRVIEACRQAGSFIPHYCYHPRLSSPGNCRMCLIEMGMPKMGADRKPELGEDGKPVINWIPRPQISCAQDVAEGMAIKTDSPMAQECRKGVMEFLLINHPLDCPICDQAGECKLQEFSVEYGSGGSRFREEKVKKPKNVELGPRVTLDDERCILCSRCVRFMQEVAKDDVLGFVNRGSFSTLTCHPGKQLDSNYSLNTVDICPVGALTSSDFRFRMRVWFLKETKSICTSCATGCNTVISSRENEIHRQTPRDNEAVNKSWMCDYGRLNFHFLASSDRLKEPAIRGHAGDRQVKWENAIESAATQLKTLRGEEIAMIASARMTNEEMFLAKRLADSLGITLLDTVPRMEAGDGILLSADRNPNSQGAALFGLSAKTPGARLTEIRDGINAGGIKGLIVLHEDTSDAGIDSALLSKLEALVVMGILPGDASRSATVVLPGSGFAEKRGSMINGAGRIQRLNRAVNPPGRARDDWEILRDLVAAVGGGNSLYVIEDVFKQIAATIPGFEGLTISKIGDLGSEIAGKNS